MVGRKEKLRLVTGKQSEKEGVRKKKRGRLEREKQRKRERAERFEAAEEGVFQGCLTEILGVFLASCSLEKERTEKERGCR